ncbi:MAG: hypothetical protein R3Y51_01875 [Rikenellaceae bacterium]
MDNRKVVRFRLDNGEWRSKVYYTEPKEQEADEEHPKTDAKDDSVWSKPKYDTAKYESYIHYMQGIEKENTTENKTLFNRKITASWGELQPELTKEEHQFSAEAHKYSAEMLIDTLKNENATKNIERLSKMSREEVETEYKFTNKFALSNIDNIEQRVNNAFLKGEGLEDVTINGKIYQGLLFDENSQQSKMLKENGTFKTYYNNYLSCMKEIISESSDAKDINIEAISMKLKTKLGKPDFSTIKNLVSYDYFGLMGGTQNIKVYFEIIPTPNGEYNLKTTMNINDWYGADEGDINGSRGTFKGNIKGLKAFFYLQHHYDCKPFPTQIIYKSENTLKLDK